MPKIHSNTINRVLVWLNVVMALVYFSWWLIPAHVGNPVLYGLLLFGEIYHLIMALMFWQTVRESDKISLQQSVRKNQNISDLSDLSDLPISSDFSDSPISSEPSVAIFITVVSEPVEVVRKTVLAARDMDYKNHKVYILNDGKVAKNPNWYAMETLAKELGIHCITREVPGGAKAGNINHALTKTKGEIVVIFDADMIPHKDFLQKMIPHFMDKKMGFVQSPQYYKNHALNEITAGSWEQQEFFFGPIMRGKDKDNAAFICGTNVAIRRSALMQVGGMNEDNIAEDFLTSLAIHQHGWKSVYVPEVLAEGLAPEDLLSYYKQQLRWARGSLEVLFSANPLFKKNLSWKQKLQYLSSALYYFNGVIVLIDIIMPLIFLFTGIQAVAAATTAFAIFFVPFMILNLYTLYVASSGRMTFRAISFSYASFTLQLSAVISVILKQKMGFSVTPKQAQEGNFLFLAFPHLMYIVLTIIATGFGIYREGFNPSVLTNVAWALLSIALFMPFIYASYNWKKLTETLFFGKKVSRLSYGK